MAVAEFLLTLLWFVWIILFGNPPSRQNVIWKPFDRRIKGGMTQRIAAQMRKSICNQAAWVPLSLLVLAKIYSMVPTCVKEYIRMHEPYMSAF